MTTTLPQPILDSHPEWVELYAFAWDTAKRKVKHGTRQNRFAPEFMGEAFSNHLFQWDTCLMALFARHAPGSLPALPALDNFYRKQHDDGFICRELIEADGSDYFDKESDQAINPPLFAWAELGFAQITGQLSHARKALPKLVRYFDWLKANRRTRFGLYWQSNLGSGMDNSPRDADGWVDLTAQQAHAAECIAAIAAHVGDAQTASRFGRERANIVRLLNRRCWSDDDGIYWDTFPSGRHSKQKTIASFWPMLAGAARADQAQRLIAHLRDAHEFARPHMFPSLSSDHQAYEARGFYWLGGVWAPTDYMVVKGLQRCGFEASAREAAENHIGHIHSVFKRTGTIWENYAPEVSEQGEKARPDFVGWSGLGPIAMLIENVIGIRQNALENVVEWNLREPSDRCGVRGLWLGKHRLDLVCEGGRVRTKSPVAFTLIARCGNASETHRVPAGERTLSTSSMIDRAPLPVRQRP